MITDFVELHGDRRFGDDAAIVAGLGHLNGMPVAVIGQQKGRTSAERLARNFGSAKAEGYRKAAQRADRYEEPYPIARRGLRSTPPSRHATRRELPF
jgi:acetyl-CoA carboxylase carboxyl transferase subunit alpha